MRTYSTILYLYVPEKLLPSDDVPFNAIIITVFGYFDQQC